MSRDEQMIEELSTVFTPEIFRYWLQGGRIDVGFLGAAQLDLLARRLASKCFGVI